MVKHDMCSACAEPERYDDHIHPCEEGSDICDGGDCWYE
jgi:hypothetical protein